MNEILRPCRATTYLDWREDSQFSWHALQGLLITAYLKWRGMLETTLSLYRAAGALAGIGATLCFAALHGRLGELHMHTQHP